MPSSHRRSEHHLTRPVKKARVEDEELVYYTYKVGDVIIENDITWTVDRIKHGKAYWSGQRKLKEKRVWNPLPANAKKILMKFFKTNNYPTRAQKLKLVGKTNLTLQQVSGWFGNTRAKLKRQAEDEYDSDATESA